MAGAVPCRKAAKTPGQQAGGPRLGRRGAGLGGGVVRRRGVALAALRVDDQQRQEQHSARRHDHRRPEKSSKHCCHCRQYISASCVPASGRPRFSFALRRGVGLDRDFRVMLTPANAMSGIRWLTMKLATRSQWLGLAWVLLASSGCIAAAAGAGTAAVFGSAAALTSSCYDRVSLRLTDAASGQVTCTARVSAVSTSGSELTFGSCYHAAVPPGAWKVRAELAGYTTASTPLTVPVESQCNPAVQTIELTIAPSGYQQPPPVPPTPAAPAVAAPPPVVPSAPTTAPPPSAEVPPPPPPVSASPAPSAVPPTGSFPAPPASAQPPPPPSPPSPSPPTP